jgi:hypothetical protein
MIAEPALIRKGIAGDLPEAEFLLTAAPIV